MGKAESHPDQQGDIMDIAQLRDKIVAGDRRALARAITLVESSRADHREQAAELIEMLSRKSDAGAIRVGLSGTPGVGKSTFIESFGKMLTGCGWRCGRSIPVRPGPAVRSSATRRGWNC